MYPTKTLFSSKTFWLAIIQALIAAIAIFQGSYPGIGQLLILKSMLDIALRFITTSAIAI
jgi:uncharacterized membrane protein